MTAEPHPVPAPRGRRRPVRAVVVAVPVRDEERRVRACLRSVLAAAARVPLPVVVAVALDRCVDGSRAAVEAVLGGRPGTLVVELGPAPRRTVAEVRDAAVTAGLALARRRRPVATDELWVAGTDADTVVPPGWLVEQVRRADAGADLVAGAVDLDDDPGLDRPARERYARLVRPRDGVGGEEHGHVYGADLGVRASAWRAAGGFPRVDSGEDAALLDAVAAAGGVVVRPTWPRAVTSGRTRGRADGGLADLLADLAGPGRVPSG
ncbi:glycosyltransferase [Pseudokineococcus lusitanus]|uniref:glycosyltransferase n=1 Tax=Pseudokineococcus lusitanus TaxID=763993 RepID=UPI000F4A753E|nr:glycosyltransferase [Pseudokineococcus lusitanus]